MFDGVVENPLALLLLALALLISAPAGLMAIRGSGEPTSTSDAAFPLAALAIVWGVLAPLSVLNRAAGEPMVWIFGREGEDTGLVEYATVILFAWSALACGWLARRGPRLQRWLFALGAVAAVFIAGEEISWGQWLFHWATPDAIGVGNLQNETNLHNFLPPRAWELAYAGTGWAIIATALAMRFASVLRGIVFAPLAVFRDSRFAAPLALSAGVMMQHHFLQELSEVALAAAAAYALGWIAARTPGRRPADRLATA